MKKYYDIKTRMTALTMALMMTVSSMPGLSYAGETAEESSTDSAIESQDYGLPQENAALSDETPESAGSVSFDDMGEDGSMIEPDEDITIPDENDDFSEGESQEETDGLLIEDMEEPGYVLTYSSETMPGAQDDDRVLFTVEVEKDTVFEPGQSLWVEERTGNSLDADASAVCDLFGSNLAKTYLSFEAKIVNADGTQADITEDMTVRVHTDDGERLKNSRLAFCEEGDTWKEIPFTFYESTDDTLPYAEFHTEELSIFSFSSEEAEEIITDETEEASSDDISVSEDISFTQDIEEAIIQDFTETEADTENAMTKEPASIAQNEAEPDDAEGETLFETGQNNTILPEDTVSVQEDAIPSMETEAETETKYLEGTIVHDSEDIIVTVTVSEENRIPAGSVLCVEKIDETSEVYRQYFENLMSYYNVPEESLTIYPYDVHFELDGEKVEPEYGDVAVSFEMKEAVDVDAGETANVVHITDSGEIAQVVEDAGQDGEITEFDFTVESFSGIIITKVNTSNALLGADNTTTVTFNPTGGVLPVKTKEVELNVTVAEDLPVPTKAGHIFLGWFSQREGGYQFEEGDIYDRTLYFAQWREISYTLILHPNGTGDEPLEYTLNYRDILELNDTIFALDGYILGSWNTNRFGTGTTIPANTDVSRLTETDGDTVTLYAIWTNTPYSITFDEQGGTEVPDILVADGKTAGNKMIDSHMDGYTFLGWFTRPTGGTQITSSTVIHSDYYLYARFEKNPQVSFDPNDENAIIAEKDRTRVVPYGGKIGELPNVKNGAKDFMGWYTRPYGGTQISSSAIVYTDTTYYAQYGYKPYFDTNGGKIITADRNQAKQSSSYMITSFPVVSRDGYELEGWYLPDGETQVHLNDIVDLSEDRRIIAHWVPSDKAVVTFNYNGGTANPKPASITVYKDVALEQLPSPTKSGYKFEGWYDEEGNLYKKGTVVTDDVTLTARWAQKNVTVTFDSQGGKDFDGNGMSTYVTASEQVVTEDGLKTITYNIGGTMKIPEGDTINVLPGAKKDEKTLAGWYTQPDGQGEKLTTDTIINEDVTYYAYWVDKNEYVDESGLKYTYSVYWNNTSNTTVSNNDNRLVFTPSSNGDVTARLYVNFELEKTTDDLSIPEGSIEVRVPKYIWKNWSGANIGSTNIDDLFVKAPELPENDYFNYYEETDYYVITNCVPLNGGAGFLKEFEYTVTPSDVRGGAIDSNGDIVDGYRYFDNTVNVTLKIDKDLDGVYDTSQKKQLDLEMHTQLKAASSKFASSTVYVWNSSWGTKPADADDYFYVVWNITNRGLTSSTQGGTYSISEDNTTHDGTIVYSTLPKNEPYDITSGTTYYYTVVTRHSRELLNDAVLNPVRIYNEAVITDTWKSGYQTERRVSATTSVSVIEHPTGEFDKKNSLSSTTINGGQEKIVTYGDRVYIPFYTVYDGGSNVVPSWDAASGTYSTAVRRMMIQDGCPGDLKYSSGASDPRYAWNANVKDTVLSDSDYSLDSIYITVTERDSEQVGDKWLTPWAHTDHSTFKPVNVYVRYRGESDFTFYRAVDLTSSSSSTVYFPDNVVGYRVEHDSDFFTTRLYVSGAWYVEPTSRVYNLIADDVDNGYTSIVKNQANCKVWWPTRDGVPETAGIGEEHAYIDVSAWRYYELNISKDYLYADKYIWPATANASDKTQTSQVRISGWNYNNAGNQFKTDTGVLYDLLPKGVSVDKDSVTGYAVGNRRYEESNYAYYSKGAQISNNYYNVLFVDDWEGSGRTMMIINFVVPKGIYATGVDFYYDMVDSQENIEYYGTARDNDIAYANTSEITRDIASIRSNKDIIEEEWYFDSIDDSHDFVAYSTDKTVFKNIISETWGFDKSVKTETTTGYVFDGSTPLNEDYTYKLHYSQSENSKTHNLVIYDVLEAGTDLINSEWLGTFVSADASDYARVRNALPDDDGEEGEGETAVLPAFCAPVIYYSTKPRDEFPDVDQNFSMEGTAYDLSDTSIWSTTLPADLSEVTAVAFDMRKDADGNDMVFEGKKSLNVYIRMHSPSNTELIEKTNGNAAVITTFRESSEDTTYEHSEASVRIIDEDIELHKTSDPASGTQEAPAKVSRQEPLTYTLTVKNTGTEYIMKDVVVEDEIPEGLTVEDIQVHFGNASSKIDIEDSPRVSMETDGRKRTFTISRLNEEETCYIIINTTVTAEESIFVNGSEVTSVNGIERHIESEITYHEEENSMEVSVRKESDSRTLLAGASLQILNSDGEVVESWISTSEPHKTRLYPGTYTLHEVSAPEHFLAAEDIEFEVTQDKYLKVEGKLAPQVKMTDVETTDVEGVKAWFGDGTGTGRPSSITVNLVRDGEVIDSKEVTAADKWKYSWTDLEKYSSSGKEYIYEVVEEDVPEGYTFFGGTEEYKLDSGLIFTFDSSSETESVSYDYLIFYYYKDGVWYQSNKYGGSLANVQVKVPSEMVYIQFTSDSSVTKRGFNFSSISPYTGTDYSTFTSVSSVPSYSSYGTYVGTSYPYYLNYTNNQKRRYIYKLTSSTTWGSASTPVVVPASGDVLYNMVNAKPTPVRIAKLGESGSTPLPGAEMILTGVETISNKRVEHHITSGTSVETIDLFPGSYTLHEVTPPAGYYMNADVTFSVALNGKITFSGTAVSGTDVYIRDYKTRLQVYKYNRSGSSLSGCTFQIWREADVLDPDALLFMEGAEPVAEWTGSSQSQTGVLDSGENYWLIETEVPEGYEKLSPYYIKLEESASSSTTITVRLYNEWQPVEFEVSKKNEDGDYVAGAMLRLTGNAKTNTDPTTNATTPVSETWMTTGSPKSFSLRPGTYTLTEVKRPSSNEYLLNESPITIYVTNTRQIYYSRNGERIDSADIVMYDKYNKTELPFKKVWNDTDYEGSRPASVTFELYQNGTKYSEQVLTADDASDSYTWEGVFTDLPILDPSDAEYEYEINEIADIENYVTTYNSSETSGMLVTFSSDSDLGDGSVSMLVKRNGSWYNAVMLDITDLDSEAATSLSGDLIAGKTIYVPTKGTDGRIAILLSESTKSRNFAITSVVPTLATFDGRNGTLNSSFNETQITSVWKQAEYPYLSEVGAQQEECIMFTASGSSESFVGADLITNTSLLTSVELRKVWEDGGDVENRPDSITLDLYNERDLDSAVQTVELTADNSEGRDVWTYTIRNLPQFNDDGSEAKYLYKERSVEGYRTFYTKSDIAGMYLKLSDDSTTDGGILNFIIPDSSRQNNNYLYVNAVRDFTEIGGLEVYIPFTTDYHDVFLALKDAGENASVTIESVTPVSSYEAELYVVYGSYGNTQESGYFSGENVQVLDGNGVIRYKYLGESNVSSSGSYVVNESSKTSVMARKVWQDDSNAAGVRPENITVEVVNELDPDTVIREVVLSGEGDTWEVEVQDLDRYNADGSAARYIVREKGSVENYAAFYENSDSTGFLVTFANEQDFTGTVTFYSLSSMLRTASRIIYNGKYELSADDIAGKQIYIEKGAYDGFCFSMSEASASNALHIENVEAVNIDAVTDINSYTAAWSSTMNPLSITQVSEPSFTTSDYGAVSNVVYEYTSGVTEAYVGSEIVNRYNLTDISVTKRWERDTEEDRPETITFNLYNADDMETVIKSKTLAKGEESLTFENLPKYEEDGKTIRYVAMEEPVPNYNTYYEQSSTHDAVGFMVEFEKQGSLSNILIQDGTNPDAGETTRIMMVRNRDLNSSYYGSLSTVGTRVFVPFGKNDDGDEMRAFMLYGCGIKVKSIELAYDESLLDTVTTAEYNTGAVKISMYNYPVFTGDKYPDYASLRDESYSNTQYLYMTYLWAGSTDPVVGSTVVTNSKNVRDFPFKKIFDDEGYEDMRPASFTVYLKDSEGNVIAEKELEVTGEEVSGVFENVPYLDEDGNEIQYHVEEKAAAGYKAFYSMSNPKGFWVTFSNDTDMKSGSLKVLANNAQFNPTASANADRISTTDSMSKSGTSLAGKTIYVPINENFRIDEEPYFGIYAYINYNAQVSLRSKYAVTNVALANTYEPHMFSVGNTNSYALDIMRKYTGLDYPSSEKSMGTYGYGAYYDCNIYVWSPVPYTFDGCDVIYNRPDKTEFEVTKDWEDFDESVPASVTIDLYDSENMESPIETKEVSITGKTTTTVFTDLPKYREDGSLIVYTAKEHDIEGYRANYGNSEYLNGSGGLYVTFSEDTDLGSGGYVVLYTDSSPVSSNGNYYYYYTEDIKGKTVFVPTESRYDTNHNRPGTLYVYYSLSGTYTDCKLKITDISWGYKDTKDVPAYLTSWSAPSNPLVVLGMNEGFDSDEYNKFCSSGYYLQFLLDPDDEVTVNNECLPGSNYIYNKTDKVDVPYSKTWDDEGYEDRRPESVTFRAYNINDLETEVASVEISSGDDMEGVFENLPKYNEDGTEAIYTVIEDEVEGYTQTYSLDSRAKKPAGFKVTFSDDTYISNGELRLLTNTGYYRYINGGYSKYRDELAGKTVYLRTHEVNGSYGFYLYYYNSSSNYTTDYNNGQEGKQQFQITNVEPVYKEEYGGYNYPFYGSYSFGRVVPHTNDYHELNEWFNIVYGNSYEGYILKDVPEPMAGLSHITNHVEKTEVSFTKSWQNEDESAQRPASITIDLYKEGLDEIIDTKTLSGSDTEGVFDDLPKYDKDGNEIRYYVKERPVAGYITRYAADDSKVNGFYITFSDDFSFPNARVGSYSYITFGCKYSASSSNEVFTKQFLYPYGKYSEMRSDMLAGRTIFVPFDLSFDLTEYGIPNSNGSLGITHEAGAPHELGISIQLYNGTLKDMTGAITDIKLGYEPNKSRYVLGASNSSTYSSTFTIDTALTPLRGSHYPSADMMNAYASYYGNSYHNTYFKYIWEDDEYGSATPSFGATNIVNVYEPYKVTKQWDDEGHEDDRPDTITLNFYDPENPDTVVLTKTLNVDSSADEQEYVIAELPVQRADGSYIKYLVQENDIEGYVAKYSLKNITGYWLDFDPAVSENYTNSSSNYLTFASDITRTMTTNNNQDYWEYNSSRYTYMWKYSSQNGGMTSLYARDLSHPVFIQQNGGNMNGFLLYNNYYSSTGSYWNYAVTRITPVRRSITDEGTLSSVSTPSYGNYYTNFTGMAKTYLTGEEYPDSSKYRYQLYEWTPVLDYTKVPDCNLIINEIDKTYLPVRKIWNDEGHEDKRPQTLSFNVYNVRDMDTVVKTATFDVNESGAYVIEDLPKYNTDGTKAQYKLIEKNAGYYETSYEIYGMGEAPDGFIVKFSNDTYVYSNYAYLFPIKDAFNLKSNLYTTYGGSSFGGSSNLIWADSRNTASGGLLNNRYVYIPNMSDNKEDAGFVLYLNNMSGNCVKIDSVEPVYGSLDQYGVLGKYLESHYYTNGQYNLTSSTGWTYNNAAEINGRIGTGFNFCEPGISYWVYRWNPDADTYNYQNSYPYAARPRAYMVYNKYAPKQLKVEKEWDDEDYVESRPSSLKFNLKANGTVIREITLTSEDAVDDFHWEKSIEDLPVYDDDGNEIAYKIEEEVPEGYHVSYGLRKVKGLLVTFDDDTGVWNGGWSLYSARDGMIGPNQFYLQKAGDAGSNKTFYVPVGGNTYYVPVEDNPDSDTIDFFIQGGHMYGAHVAISDIKPVYYDEPGFAYISETTYAGNVITSDTRGEILDWYYGQGDLQVYNYNYTTDGTGDTGSNAGLSGKYIRVHKPTEWVEGTSFVNSRVRVPFEKIWDDGGVEELRPESITVSLYNKNDMDEPAATKEFSVVNGEVQDAWFDDMPRYNEDGTLIEWVIREEPVENYKTRYITGENPRGFWVTFSDDTVMYGSDSITICTGVDYPYNLGRQAGAQSYYANPAITKAEAKGNTFYIPVVTGENTGLTFYELQILSSFSNAESKYKVTSIVPDFDGDLTGITYNNTMRLIDSSRPLRTVYGTDYPESSSSETVRWVWRNSLQVVNESDKVRVKANKYWDDAGYEDLRPDSITMDIKNGDEVVDTVTLKKEDGWQGYSAYLPKYDEDDHEIVYSVEEHIPAGYTKADEAAGITGLRIKFSEDSYASSGILFYIANSEHAEAFGIRDISESNIGTNTPISSELAGAVVYIPIVSKDFTPSSTNSNYADDRFAMAFVIQCLDAASHFEIESIEAVSGVPEDATVVYQYGDSTGGYPKDLCNTISFDDNYPVKTASDTGLWLYYELRKDDLIPAHSCNVIKKWPVSIKKVNDIGEFVAGARLQIKRKDTGDIVEEIVSNSLEAIDVMLPAGTYLIHESYTPDNYHGLASDIEFSISDDGTVIMDKKPVEDVEVKNKELVNISGTKTWSGDSPADRPESITVNLYANGKKTADTVITAEDDWKYDFGSLERYDENGDEIVYTVDEEIVRNYGRRVSNGTTEENFNNNVGVEIHLSDSASVGEGSFDIYYQKDEQWYHIPVETPIGGKTIYVPTYIFDTKIVVPNYSVYGVVADSIEYVSGQKIVGEEVDGIPEGDYETKTSIELMYLTNTTKRIHFNLGNTADHTELTEDVQFLDYAASLTNGIENIKLPDPFEVSFKKVATNGMMLSGAEFSITGREKGAHYDIEPITFTSSADAVTVKNLRPGNYHLNETKSPAGCLRQLSSLDFVIDEDGVVTVDEEEVDVVSMTDPETVFRINKIDKDTGEPVIGATFQILDTDEHVVAEWTTDGNVKVLHAVLDVETEYTLHEKSHPDNYKPIPDLSFSMNPDGTVQLKDGTEDYLEVRSGVMTVLEEKTSVKFKKVNENGDPVPGARFTLTGTGTPAFTRTWTSDGTDHLISEIPAGQYTLSETSPSGYESISPVTLTIDEMSAVTISGSNNEGQVLVDENDVSLVVVTNRYTRHNLEISKKVEGNFGNRTKEFRFTLTLEEAEGGAKIPHTITGIKTLEDGTSESSEYEPRNGVLEFTLRDSVSIRFENIPYGMGYKVEENASSSKGYDVTAENKDGTITQDTEVSFVNRRDSIVPTLLDSGKPVIPVMIAIILLIGIFIFRRRKRLSQV